MKFFKKKPEKNVKKEELKKVVEATSFKLGRAIPYRTEYLEFLKEIERKPHTLYEKACSISENILKIKPSKDMQAKLEEELKAAYINATPAGALSLAIMVSVFVLIFAITGIFLGIGIVFGIFALIFVFGVGYYFYNYPATQAKRMAMRMSADTVLAILYMVVYMRSSPNLEGAIKFAANNLSGPLAWDLRKLLWDIELGIYPSADSALVNYIFKWKEKNKEFAESLHLLRGCSVEPARRDIIFNETINVILNGTRERAKHYAANLRMPMMLIHAMGVLLPVMGLVLFPIVLIFMSESVKPVFIFFGYDILLPAFLYFFTDYILQTRPPTFSQPDLSRARGIPPLGKFSLGGRNIPIWPITFAIAIPIIFFSALQISSPQVFLSVNFSILMIVGVGMAITSYCLLDSYQKLKIRNDIERIEDEFSVALFQLGNTISGGAPIELAIDKARDSLKNLKISEMFSTVSVNMREFGYTFEQALFDKNVGAVWNYPSKLIHSIMQTLVESSRKSVRYAADSMIVISNYLKSVHDVKEEIDDILGETISSMKFLAMFLAPLVAGITVTMAVIILQILTTMAKTMGSIMGSVGSANVNAAQMMFIIPSMASGGLPISPAGFQIIVGIYMLETAILLAMFLNRIQYGEDIVGERSIMGTTIILACIIYFISWIVVYSMFGGPISKLLTPTL